jgi:hypothetical protein
MDGLLHFDRVTNHQSSVEYHPNYQYVDFDGSTYSFFLIFSDESGH